MSIRAEDALTLSVEARIQLVAEIWDTIAESPDEADVLSRTESGHRRLTHNKISPENQGCFSQGSVLIYCRLLMMQVKGAARRQVPLLNYALQLTFGAAGTAAVASALSSANASECGR